MAIMVWFDIEGATPEQYDRIISGLDEQGLRHVPRRRFHAAGPADGRWRVCDVWDTAEAFQQFVDDHLGPLAAQVQLPPFEPQVMPVHNLIDAAGTAP